MLRRLWRWKWVIIGVSAFASQFYGLCIDLDGHNKWGTGFLAGVWFQVAAAGILNNLKD